MYNDNHSGTATVLRPKKQDIQQTNNYLIDPTDNLPVADHSSTALAAMVYLPVELQSDDTRVRIQQNLTTYFNGIFKKLRPNTRKTYTSGLSAYIQFCLTDSPVRDLLSPDFEAQKNNIMAFMDHQMTTPRKRSVIHTHFAAISKILRVAEIRNPLLESEEVRDYIRVTLDNARDSRGRLLKPAVQSQAKALDSDLIDVVNATFEVSTLQDKRDLALVNFMFDTLLRGSEIEQIDVADLDPAKETVFVATTKTDPSGEGCYRFVSRETLVLIDDWLNSANVNEGGVFRGMAPRWPDRVTHKTIKYRAILNIIKSVVLRCGIDASGITAHSCRVGAAVSMRQNGASDSEIQQSGGWRSGVFHRYTQQTAVQYSGAARLAQIKRQKAVD